MTQDFREEDVGETTVNEMIVTFFYCRGKIRFLSLASPRERIIKC